MNRQALFRLSLVVFVECLGALQYGYHLVCTCSPMVSVFVQTALWRHAVCCISKKYHWQLTPLGVIGWVERTWRVHLLSTGAKYPYRDWLHPNGCQRSWYVFPANTFNLPSYRPLVHKLLTVTATTRYYYKALWPLFFLLAALLRRLVLARWLAGTAVVAYRFIPAFRLLLALC